nr:hypothetical protein [Tanacetum cinerariifolium]
MYGSLTSEQKGIYSTVMDVVDRNTKGMFFVYGYGGTGKTYLYKTMSAALRSQGHIVLNVASSGIAALLLEGERTAHSRFAIPINILEDSMCHIPADTLPLETSESDTNSCFFNLCTLWMGSHHLHANVSRFQRPPAINSGGFTHHNGNYVPKKTEANSNNKSRMVKMSYVNVVNGDTKSTEACEP